MAFSTDYGTNSDVDAMIKEVWTPIVNEEMFAKMVLSNFFTDLTQYAVGGGDYFHVPDVFSNSFTALQQSTEATEVTSEMVAQSDVTLRINQHWYIAMVLGNMTVNQIASIYDLNGIYGRKMGGTVGNKLEAALAALWSSFTTNTAVGDTATVITDLELRTAINTIEGKHFDTISGDVAWFMHPTPFYLQVMGIQKYYDSSMNGTGRFLLEGTVGKSNAAAGQRGTILGAPLFLSTNIVKSLETYRNFLAHKSAAGWATQTPGSSPVKIESTYEHRNLARLVTAEIIYGVAKLRGDAWVNVYGKDSATTS